MTGRSITQHTVKVAPPADDKPALAASVKIGPVGRFELIREVGRGGMGQVFLARDTVLGRKVAIKFLLFDDAELVQRFLVEARATARCTHENIVTIYEVDEHEGRPFIVLEWLEGRTLDQLVISFHELAELMVPVLRALQAAHAADIVHRDLKPNNIVVTERGVVKVLDFGVAKFLEDTDDTFAGTVPYMSPEQFGAGAVDQTSDLWAVGIMFWRVLGRSHPVGTQRAELIARYCESTFPLPSIATVVPDLPAAIVALVDKCLAIRKSDRYQSAADVLADLQSFLHPRDSSEVCPYRGLAAFREGDVSNFFGRTSEIRAASAHLETSPLLAIVGPSGVGKSSFVHAGLIPALRAASPDWEVRVLRPGRTPLASLTSVLADPVKVTPVLLAEQPGWFGDALRTTARAANRRILVVVDQLEEIFTLSDDAAARTAFLAALLAAADDASSPVRVVLSVRADFLDRLGASERFDELARGLFVLSPPDEQNLREILIRPAELAGYAFEERVIDDMLETATSRGALPLLQFVATKLWDTRDRDRRLLTRRAYEAMGGMGGAFARHADEVVASLPPHDQPVLRALLMRLVTPEGTRAVVDRADLEGLGEVARILDVLVRARLVHVHSDATVEIVHEVLITEWPTLRRWLDETHALRGFLHELQLAARQWMQHGRAADRVWRGAIAQEALGHTRRHALDLTETERAFIAAIHSLAARGRRKRLIAITAIATAVALVLIGGTIAYVRIAQAERVAAQRADEAANRARELEEAERKRVAAELRQREAETATSSSVEREKAANNAVVMSREELERALDEARHERDRATRSAAKARAATDERERTNTQLEKTNTQLEQLLDAERKRVRDLEQGKQGIAKRLTP